MSKISKHENVRSVCKDQTPLCPKCFSAHHLVLTGTRPNCEKCDGKHHQLLHRESGKKFEGALSGESYPPPSLQQIQQLNENKNKSTLVASNVYAKKVFILGTAVAFVFLNEHYILVRLLLDPCVGNMSHHKKIYQPK